MRGRYSVTAHELRSVPKYIETEVAKELARLALERTQAECPVRTGKLKASLRSGVVAGAVRLWSSVRYAIYVHVFASNYVAQAREALSIVRARRRAKRRR